jgi:hypothetical protein
LPALVTVTDYDLDEIARLLNAVEPPLAGPGRFTIASLKAIARAWMDDMHEYCNVANSISGLDPMQTGYMLRLRNFRRANPWLRGNYGAGDWFDYLKPIDGRTVFAALRNGPDGQQVFTIAHMEGADTDAFDPAALDIPGLAGKPWTVALRTPSIGEDYQGGPLVLRDSMAITLIR